MSELIKMHVEYTDTFGGEANYSWVKRVTLSAARDIKDRTAMRAAKESVGLTGVRGRVSHFGDMIEFRPYGMCTVMFVTFEH